VHSLLLGVEVEGPVAALVTEPGGLDAAERRSQVADVEMAGFPYAGTYIGPAAVAAGVFRRIGEDWTDYRADPECLVSDGPDVVAFGVYSGTFTATGQFMRARFVHHWTVRDGKVVRFEQYTDTHLVRQAMETEVPHGTGTESRPAVGG
jgi:ketosteroid isomerase-like protein